MPEISEQDIADVAAVIVSNYDDQIQTMSQSDLEQFWCFRWDKSALLQNNIYRFHRALDVYGRMCRRWEDEHNGHYCLVERVRDTYLMPKIREFSVRVQSSVSGDA